MRFSLRRQPCFAPILTPCVADSRQRHALAVSVFKTATRFAASTDPVRFASPTAGARRPGDDALFSTRSEEHTSELQSLMRISYAVFCLKNKKTEKYCTQESTQFASY